MRHKTVSSTLPPATEPVEHPRPRRTGRCLQWLNVRLASPAVPGSVGALTLLLLLAAASARAQTPTQAWLARYSGVGNGNCQVTAMTIDPQGCTYVTGYSNGAGWDFATVKYSPGGRQLAVARFNGQANLDDVPYAITRDAQGNIIVVGYTDGDEQTKADFVTVKYDSTLTQQWVRTYAGQFNLGLDQADAVVTDAVGKVFVGGFSFEAPTGDDYVTIKYDAAGTQQWVERYNGPGNSDDGVKSMALDADDDVYVTGVSQRNPLGGNYDATTIKYNSDGVQQWIEMFNGTANGNDGGLALQLDPERNVYVAGYTSNPGQLFDMLLLKYNKDGQQQWIRSHDGSHGYDAALALTLDSNNNAYITGYVSLPTNQADYATVKFDSAGTQQWVATYNGPVNGFDEGQAVAVDVAGNVYVTGYSDGGVGQVNYDYATVKYDASGAQQWAVRYNGTGNNIDVAAALVLDPEDDVIVSGWSTNTHNTDVDYVTIKYHQIGTTAVPPLAASEGPLRAVLSPNPFRDATTLRFRLPVRSPVELTLWDVSGRKVRTLALGSLDAGNRQAVLPGGDLAPGVYVYRLSAEKTSTSGKIVRR